MLSRLSIAVKFGLIGFVGCVALGVVLGTTAVWRSQEASKQAAETRLYAVADARSDQISDYLESINQDIATVASNPNTLAALNAFDASWRALGQNATAHLQRAYIAENPHPVGERENLDAARDGSAYSAAHATFHPWFRSFLRARGYYDVFLFNTDGDLVYSVFKEADFATNLMRGPHRDTDLGHIYRQASALPASEIAFIDFAPYAPSNDAPASFIATPVFDDGGNRAGVLVFQMPISRLNAVAGALTGLGETGEAYIIGDDGLMRTDTRFADGSTILEQRAGDAIEAAMVTNQHSVIETMDHLGNRVFAAVAPTEFHGVRWATVVTMTQAEALAASRSLTITLLVAAIVLTLLVGAIGVWIAMKAAKPLQTLTDVTRSVAAGDLQIEVPHRDRQDEIGALAETIDQFKQSLVDKARLERESADAEAAAAERMKAERLRLAEEFENSVGAVVSALASAASQLSQSAESLSASSEQTSNQAVSVAASAEQATANVETVATAAEEMSASIGEIGRQAVESSQRATTAEEEASVTVRRVEALTEAANRIGTVVSLIQDIAEQTNLLALNATIEAARAGEAGKGFAIVAQEVKQLAAQTAGATTEISQQIEEIQSATGVSAKAIGSVAGAIADLNRIAGSISDAMEEQAAATREIASNVQEAATGTRDVTVNIAGVNEAASESRTASVQVLDAAKDLSRQSELLRDQVDGFLANIRAA
ncbi:MAG: methyl-accepting chemotaxis protein [Pseudomonadota bacterium]|nr:methyl-accepting chemotaxis protein [Pseudomonadota bacterium]